MQKEQHIEFIGNVTHVLENRMTVNLGIPVTVDAAVVRLVSAYKAPTTSTPLLDKLT